MSIIGEIVGIGKIVAEEIRESKKKKEESKLQKMLQDCLSTREKLEGRLVHAWDLNREFRENIVRLESKTKDQEQRIETLNARVRSLQEERDELEREVMLADLPDSPYEAPEGSPEAVLDDAARVPGEPENG